jgi:hypothetical protein
MADYVAGTDKQGNARFVRVPDSMTLEEAHDITEWALDPPYGTVYPMTMRELRALARENGYRNGE